MSTKNFLETEPASNVFSRDVEKIARFLSIETVHTVRDVTVPALGATALILDADGTLYKYNEEPEPEIIDWVMEANEYLEGQLLIVSNNRFIYPFDKVKHCNRQSWHDYKFSSLRNRKAIKSLDEDLDDSVFAITDSASDIFSNRLAGIPLRNQILVKSLGGHPKQEAVREHIYPRVAKTTAQLMTVANLK